jgi:hypothetical protein
VATFGGVFGPILMYFVFLNMFDAAGAFDNSEYTYDDLTKGWGITTATDISLGWATALMVFGPGHPGVYVGKHNYACGSTPLLNIHLQLQPKFVGFTSFVTTVFERVAIVSERILCHAILIISVHPLSANLFGRICRW